MEKADIINRIIKETKATSYLEVGYGNGHNFNRIKCKHKESIEPDYKGSDKAIHKMTSDDYFKETHEFDVIFIDGLHHADQVRKDITNALKCNPKAVLIHDTLPYTEEMQIVPRKQTKWTGDVWCAAVGFHEAYPEIKLETYRADYGLTVIYPEGKKVRKYFEDKEMTYDEFKDNEVKLLNIVD